MKKALKTLSKATVAALPWLPALAARAQQGEISQKMLDAIRSANFNLGTNEPGTAVGGILNALLTLLGLTFLTIIFYGGYVWMTAWGNEERLGKAKRIINAGMIGIFILVASFGIATFVVRRFAGGTGLEIGG